MFGSRIPCGSSPRTRATASRTSVVARSTGVPIWNSTKIIAWPSVAREVMFLTLPTVAIEPSTFCKTWVSISVGAAPGTPINTCTNGAETSGLRVTGMRTKATMPKVVSTARLAIKPVGKSSAACVPLKSANARSSS